MTSHDAYEAARARLPVIAAELRANFKTILEVAGAPVDRALADPPLAAGYLQAWVSHLSLDELEPSDWVTLHTDLVTLVVRIMEHYLGATWEVAPEDSERGYRYHLVATDTHGVQHRVDPWEVVALELQDDPIVIARMLASAELSLGQTWED